MNNKKVLYVENDDCYFEKEYATWVFTRNKRDWEVDPYSDLSKLLDLFENQETINIYVESNKIIKDWIGND